MGRGATRIPPPPPGRWQRHLVGGVRGEEDHLHQAGGAVGPVHVIPAEPAVLLGREAGGVQGGYQPERRVTGRDQQCVIGMGDSAEKRHPSAISNNIPLHFPFRRMF